MGHSRSVVNKSLGKFLGKQVRNHDNVPLGTVTWVGDGSFEVSKGWLNMPLLTRKKLIATDQVDRVASHYVRLRPLSNLYWQMPCDEDDETIEDKGESHYFVL